MLLCLSLHNVKGLCSETVWPIKAKLHVEHPQEGGKKAYINGPIHMTEMDAMHL